MKGLAGRCVLLLLIFFVTSADRAAGAGPRTGRIYTDFPESIHAGERYVIYMHGKIVEGNDERPVSPDYGLYDFPAVKRALFDGGGFNLIAWQRPKDVALEPSVALLESWVRKLAEAGVKPSRITLVGFSRGGGITARASARVRDLGVNTAVLAVCSDGDLKSDPPIVLGGHVLSIYETTDVMGSCAKLGSRGTLTSFEEVSISTGRRHGAFFQPLPEWIRPLKDWIARTNR